MTKNDNKFTSVPPKDLLFDLHNPRLALELADCGDGGLSIVQAIEYLNDNSDLQELITSIARNGYIPFEPLIVIAEGDKYKVLEGNRRLAAIKLILDADLRKKTGIPVNQKIEQHVLDSMKKISIYKVDKAEEAVALIGFKHIKGPYKWNSFAKAQYVTKQYKNGSSIADISQEIGDKNQTVRNLVGGLLVLEQAIEHSIFSIFDRSKSGPFGLSHLYTALGRSEYQEFLGLESGWDKSPELEPIPKDKYDELEEVLTYIYGSKSKDFPSLIKSQNPDLRRLGKSIACPAALEQIRAGENLDIAFAETEEDDAAFQKTILKALSAVNQASLTLTKYDGQDGGLVLTAEKILRGAEVIELTVRTRHKKYSEKHKEE